MSRFVVPVTLTGPRTIAPRSQADTTTPITTNGTIKRLRRLSCSSEYTASGTNVGSNTSAISR